MLIHFLEPSLDEMPRHLLLAFFRIFKISVIFYPYFIFENTFLCQMISQFLVFLLLLFRLLYRWALNSPRSSFSGLFSYWSMRRMGKNGREKAKRTPVMTIKLSQSIESQHSPTLIGRTLSEGLIIFIIFLQLYLHGFKINKMIGLLHLSYPPGTRN